MVNDYIKPEDKVEAVKAVVAHGLDVYEGILTLSDEDAEAALAETFGDWWGGR